LFSISENFNIDLTTQVAVSGFKYINKSILFKHIKQITIEGYKINTLMPHANLITIAAHSFYKEQMFLLSDFYAFALLLEFYEGAFNLAKIAHVKFAFEEALKRTYLIAKSTYGNNEDFIHQIEKYLKMIDMTSLRNITNMMFPLKYSPYTIFIGFLKKFKDDPISRTSFPTFLQSISPNFLNKFIEHINRKWY